MKDRTIEATWNRVASALTQVERAADRPALEHLLMYAMAAWQLLPDARLLGSAGTPDMSWADGDLVAVLNIARFVRAPCTEYARFDFDALETVAALAVHVLDNAALLQPAAVPRHGRLRIGMIGLADALALTGLVYDSAAARSQSALVARALCNGCLNKSIQLAHDRGPQTQCDEQWHRRAIQRGTSAELIRDATNIGLRHGQLTEITSQQRLAWFANQVADALNPMPARPAGGTSASNATGTILDASGYCATLRRQLGGPQPHPVVPTPATVPAQLELRAALQNWIDETIDYPVQVDREPGADEVTNWSTLANNLGLGGFAWHTASLHPPRSPVSA